MKDTWNEIIYIWKLYWNDGYYQYLLLAAAAYLLIFHRKKKSTRQVLSFSACVLFVFLCPLTARVIMFCIGESVYWRVLWLLPTIPVIALAATEFLRGRHSKIVQAVLLLLCCGVIALAGRDMLSAGNYTRTVNRQKVPDDIAHICSIILEEARRDGIAESDIRMISDEYVASYVRVYDPSITQAYGRWGRNPVNKRCRLAYHYINRITPRRYRKIAKLSSRGGCNFLVLDIPVKKARKVERFGYVKIGQVGSYDVYQLEKS